MKRRPPVAVRVERPQLQKQDQRGKIGFLFVTSSLDFGGTERHLASISGILRARSWPRSLYRGRAGCVSGAEAGLGPWAAEPEQLPGEAPPRRSRRAAPPFADDGRSRQFAQ